MLRFSVALDGSATGPHGIDRLLARVDDARLGGRLRLASSQNGPRTRRAGGRLARRIVGCGRSRPTGRLERPLLRVRPALVQRRRTRRCSVHPDEPAARGAARSDAVPGGSHCRLRRSARHGQALLRTVRRRVDPRLGARCCACSRTLTSSQPKARSGCSAGGRSDGRRRRPDVWFVTDALGLAAEIRSGGVSPGELVDDAIRRAEAANPELNFLVTDCFEQARASTPASGPFSGVPMLVKDLTETAGLRTTFSSRAFANYVPTHDCCGRAADEGCGLCRDRQEQHARVRDHCGHGIRPERRVPESLGPLAHAGRLVGRRGSRGRCRCAPARARLGRRRLAPHSGLLLRPLRDQAFARPGLGRTLPERLARAFAERPDLRLGARRRRVSRRARRLRAGRCSLGAAAEPAVPRRGRSGSRAGCGSRSRPSPRFRIRSIQP